NAVFGFIPEVRLGDGRDGSQYSMGSKKLSERVGEAALFSRESIGWTLLEEEKDDVVQLISLTVLFRDQYHSGNYGNMYFSECTIKERLAFVADQIAFADDEKARLLDIEVPDGGAFKMVLPTKDQIEAHNPDSMKADLFTVADKLSSHEGYQAFPFWTMSKATSDTRRKVVRWNDKTYTDCLLTDDEIGVRPVIRVKAKVNKGGGGGTSSSVPTSEPAPKNPTASDVNGTLVTGIITGVLGVSALTAFLILWSKKAKVGGFKAPGWYFAIIFVAVGCCGTSIICLSTTPSGGGGGGGSGTIKYGYYVESGQPYSGGGIAQVGYTAWLIKSDGTFAYCPSLEDNDKATDFWVADKGEYVLEGSKITMAFSNPLGTFESTYTIKGDKLYYAGSEAYHWVRGE
ncbi:MAG: hypothetical protein J5736_01515, partial [Bacilli bacterium]|nr:hypothetical protein [Bacilli bacterium]